MEVFGFGEMNSSTCLPEMIESLNIDVSDQPRTCPSAGDDEPFFA